MIRGRWWTRGQRVKTKKSSGYTIVETMIFLAVSGAMFVSVMGLIFWQAK